MRRFETPPAPPGWTGQGATLIRIVDPLGDAIAWLAPDYGGACVGYAIRRDDASGTHWHQILRASSPREWRGDPRAIGVTILGPTADDPDAASQTRWQLVERDPTAATCAARCGPARLLYTARLEAASLHLDLRAEQATDRPQPLALGLRLTFADDLRRTADDAAGPSLRTGDDLLRLTLVTAQRLYWQGDGIATHVALELRGEVAVKLVIRHEAEPTPAPESGRGGS